MQGSRRVARNIGSTLLTQGFSWAITLFMISFVSRNLHSGGSGRLLVASAYGAILSVLYGMVSGFVLVRDIARDHKKLPEMVCAALAIRVPVALVTIILGTAIACLFNQPIVMNKDIIWLIIVTLSCLFFGQVNDVLACALKGVEEFPKVNAAQLAEKIGYNIAMVTVILLHKPLTWVQASTMIGGGVLQLIVNLRALKPYWSGFVLPSKAAVKSIITQSVPFISSVFFIALYNQADPLYINLLCNFQVASWYGIPNKIIGSCIMVPVAVASAALPTLARMWHEDEQKFVKIVGQLIGLMYLAVIPFSAVMILAPESVIGIFRLQHDFDGAIPVIRVAGFTVALWFLSQMTGTALIASDRQAILSRATGIAAAVSVPSCIFLVWLFQRTMHNGAIGAAISDGVVEFMMLRAYVMALPKGSMRGWSVVKILCCVCAAIPIVLPLYFFHDSKLSLLTTIPGLIVYLPLCILFRVVDKSEIMTFVDMIRKKDGNVIQSEPVESLDSSEIALEQFELQTDGIDSPDQSDPDIISPTKLGSHEAA